MTKNTPAGLVPAQLYLGRIVVEVSTGKTGRVFDNRETPDLVLIVRFADGTEGRIKFGNSLLATKEQAEQFARDEAAG